MFSFLFRISAPAGACTGRVDDLRKGRHVLRIKKSHSGGRRCGTGWERTHKKSPARARHRTTGQERRTGRNMLKIFCNKNTRNIAKI